MRFGLDKARNFLDQAQIERADIGVVLLRNKYGVEGGSGCDPIDIEGLCLHLFCGALGQLSQRKRRGHTRSACAKYAVHTVFKGFNQIHEYSQPPRA